MSRKTILAAVLVLLTSAVAFGQDWAKKMFQTTSHDFGTLHQGKKAEYDFVLENPYAEEVHIASVHASCGCAKPELKQETIKAHQKGTITAKFDAAVFLGSKPATITVVFDKPFAAEVQLQVQAIVRGDSSVEPPVVSFGTVEEKAGAEKTIKVSHTGNEEWRITAVRSGNPHLSAEARETSRTGGQVSYEVVVRLDKDAPSGRFCEHLILVAGGSATKELPVPVEGIVAGEVTVSPECLLMGVVKPGERTTKQLVIRGRRPFRVTKVTCDGPGFSVAPPDAAVEKPLHFVTVTLLAPQQAAQVKGTVRVETDIGPVSLVTATATVAPH